MKVITMCLVLLSLMSCVENGETAGTRGSANTSMSELNTVLKNERSTACRGADLRIDMLKGGHWYEVGAVNCRDSILSFEVGGHQGLFGIEESEKSLEEVSIEDFHDNSFIESNVDTYRSRFEVIPGHVYYVKYTNLYTDNSVAVSSLVAFRAKVSNPYNDLEDQVLEIEYKFFEIN